MPTLFRSEATRALKVQVCPDASLAVDAAPLDPARVPSLTRDGTIPLETASPLFREAQLGPAGWALTYPGIVVATDGAVKEDGRMGCAYVSLDDNAMPPRAFVVFGPPSAMREELSGLDQAVADALPYNCLWSDLTHQLSHERLPYLQVHDEHILIVHVHMKKNP